MNRRSFLQTTSLTMGALFLPFSIVATKPDPKISWKEFDWMKFPCELAFRVEVKDGKHQLVSTPYYCKTQKTNLVFFEGESDLTVEKETVDYRYCIQHSDKEPFRVRKEEMEVHTNPILLHEAKKLGFTHIYMFSRVSYIVNSLTWEKQYSYFIRGAKMPDWKTNKGKLQIVNV